MRHKLRCYIYSMWEGTVKRNMIVLTDVALSSIEFESRWTVRNATFGCDPFSSVGRQLTVLFVSVVEKPAACEVVRFGAESTTHWSGRVANDDSIKFSRNHADPRVQHVLIQSVCQKSKNYDQLLLNKKSFVLNLSLFPVISVLDICRCKY